MAAAGFLSAAATKTVAKSVAATSANSAMRRAGDRNNAKNMTSSSNPLAKPPRNQDPSGFRQEPRISMQNRVQRSPPGQPWVRQFARLPEIVVDAWSRMLGRVEAVDRGRRLLSR